MKFSLSLAVHVNYTCTCVHACVHVLRVSYLCNHYSFNEPHCYPTINIFLFVFLVVFAYRVHSGQEELCTATVEAELGSKLLDAFLFSSIHAIIRFPRFSQEGYLLKYEHELREKDCEQPILVHRHNANFECEWFY